MFEVPSVRLGQRKEYKNKTLGSTGEGQLLALSLPQWLSCELIGSCSKGLLKQRNANMALGCWDADKSPGGP